MEDLTLQAYLREHTGKQASRRFRQEGFIPAVLYGEKRDPSSLNIRSKDISKLLHTHPEALHSVLSLEILSDDKETRESVIIKEIQYDHINASPVHIDFNVVSLTKAITLSITVIAKGEPAGVKQDGGILSSLLWELKVEGLAADIPKEINVDVSNLRIGDCIHVKDIVIEKGVKVLNDPEAVVFRVEPPTVEKPAEEVAAAPQEPEVIKQKKPEETQEGEEKKS